MPEIAGPAVESPPLNADGGAWRYHAACRGAGPDLFYSLDPAAVAAAKQLCHGCPVREPCASYAVAHHEQHGVWGGLAADERTDRRAERRPGPGPVPWLSDDDLRALFATADPNRPALDQLLEHTPVATATAYKYLHRARRLGAVEHRARRLYPTRH